MTTQDGPTRHLPSGGGGPSKHQGPWALAGLWRPFKRHQPGPSPRPLRNFFYEKRWFPLQRGKRASDVILVKSFFFGNLLHHWSNPAGMVVGKTARGFSHKAGNSIARWKNLFTNAHSHSTRERRRDTLAGTEPSLQERSVSIQPSPEAQ